MIKISRKTKTVLTGCFIMLVWGSLFPMVKLGYKVFSIDTSSVWSLLLFAGVRFLLSGAVLTGICAAKKQDLKLHSSRSIIQMILVAMSAVALHYGCTYTGLSMVESGKTALLKQIGVLIFICFSFVFFKEDRFTLRKLIAVFLGLSGIIILNMDSLRFSFGIGEGLVVVASFCTVIANIVSKKLTATVNPTVVAGESQLIGGAFLVVVGFIGGGKIGAITFNGILVFVYILIASVVSYGLWYTVVQRENLSEMFIIKFSEPIFAAIFGAVIMNENFNFTYAIALILTFGAILVLNLKIKSKPFKAEKAKTV